MQNIRAVIRNSILGVLVCFNPVYSMCLSEWIFGKKQVIVKESPTAVQSIKKWASEPGNIAIGIIVCYVCFNFLRSILDFKDEHDDSFFNVPTEIKPTNSIKKKNHNFIGLNTIIIDPIHIIIDQGQSIIEPDCQKVEAAHLELSIEGSVEVANNCVDQKNKEAIHKNMNPITINGQNINDIIKPDEMLIGSVEDNNISFEIENGNIEIGPTKIFNLQEILDFFAELNNTRRVNINTKKYTLSGDFHELNYQYVSSDQVAN